MVWTPQTLARAIDHTLLKPDATENEIRKLCEEALQWRVATVCVNPIYIPLCSQVLKNSETLPITVVGFPLGANFSEIKIAETQKALSDGAQEIDMVINIGALKSGNSTLVESEILKIVKTSGPIPVKVIIETALLTDEEKILACKISKNAGAAFVKTSTGFAKSGATTLDVALMRKTVGNDMGVKASGGIRDLNTAIQMLNAGANRIGCSATVQILTEAGNQK